MLRAVLLQRQLRGCVLAAPKRLGGLEAVSARRAPAHSLYAPGVALGSRLWSDDALRASAPVRAVEEEMYSSAIPDEGEEAPYSSTKVFVLNMAWQTEDEDLHQHFSSIGPVAQARVFKEPDTGRSRGRGLVEFVNSQDAQVALEQFNGTDLDGRMIRVVPWQERSRDGRPERSERFERPGRQDRSPRSSMSPAGRGDSYIETAPQELKIFVSNISYNTGWQTLKSTFSEIGPVRHVELFMKNGRPAGMAVVIMEAAEDVPRCIDSLHESELDGRTIYVREDVPKENRPPSRRSDDY